MPKIEELDITVQMDEDQVILQPADDSHLEQTAQKVKILEVPDTPGTDIEET